MALPNINISLGNAPLLWSNMRDAFDKINDNFLALDLATGGTAVDLSVLNTDVTPEYSNTYTLGTGTNQWKSVHASEWASTIGDSLNGIWAGSAQIKGIGLTIDLPAGSTVDGDLIIDPEKTFIKSIQVDGDKSLESALYGYTANFTSGLGISLQLTSASDEIEFNVDPTFDLTGSVYADDTTLLVDRAGYIRGNVNKSTDWTATVNSNVWTFKDDGTLEFPTGATLANDILASGTGNDLTLSSTDNIQIITDSDAGIVTWQFSSAGEFIVPGPINLVYGITPTFSISTTTTSGRVLGEANKSFSVVLTDGLTTAEWAYGVDGTILFPGGQSIDSLGFIGDVYGALTGNVTGDLLGNVTGDVLGNVTGDLLGNVTGDLLGNVTGDLLGNVTGDLLGNVTGDLKGSVFGDDSTPIVDATNNTLNGNLTGNVTGDLLGNVTGNVTSGTVSIVPNRVTTPEIEGVSDELLIYGNWAGDTGLSIVATTGLESVTVESDRIVAVSTDVGGSRKDWIFETTGVLTLPVGGYISGNIQGTHTGNVFTSLIDSADSSAITITPAVIFSSDIIAENEITIQGSRVINLDQLKSVVAASTDFADFQIRIAALV